MKIQRPALGREDGFSMYIVVMSMMVLLTLGAALAVAGHQSSTAVSDDELGVRALQAAEAGAQAAVHRLNLQQPADDRCITTTSGTSNVVSPQGGTNWCAQAETSDVGNNASYRYQTSTMQSGTCTGSAYGGAVAQRCIVSIGYAGAVTKRVVQRVVSSTGQDPFPVAGIVGKDFIKAKNNNSLQGGVGTNGQLELDNNSTITGTVQLWQGAPNPIGYSGAVTRNPTPFVLSPPNMLNPTTLLDSKTSNDNGRLLAGASPADSCSSGSGACYTSGTRTLNLGNNDSVTLGGGVYNFCQINLGNSSSINIATGAKVLLYIDSPGRSGSGCGSTTGGISTGNGATFSNPSQDPTALQIVIFGQAPDWPTIEFPNNLTVYASIYAPNTGFQFKNNGNLVGGLTAQSIEFKNNAFLWDNRVNDVHLATTLVYYRGAWRQCNSRVASTTAPATGCL